MSQLEFYYADTHGLRTPREEIAFTARPKIQFQSQIFRFGGSIFCLPHRPNFSDIFDLCLHWVSVVRGLECSSDLDLLETSVARVDLAAILMQAPRNHWR